MTREERHEKDEEIVKLRTSGKSFEEIAKITGRRKNFVKVICRERIGITKVRGTWTEDKRAEARERALSQSPKKTENVINETCLSIGFKYAGGYTDTNGFVFLQCPKCGTQFKRTWRGVRKIASGYQKNFICLNCAETKKAQSEIEREIERVNREQKKERSFWEQSFTQKSFSFCSRCGGLYIAKAGKKYCSETCAKSVMYSRHKDKRLNKIKSVSTDYIDLKMLYRRDNGVCWLCKTECDWNDYRTTERAFIAGETYPSIDHVIPLAKGGSHSWANVKLAHRGCNTAKGARLIGDHAPMS